MRSLLRLSVLLTSLSVLFMIGCSGGGNASSQQSGLLTMAASKGSVSVNLEGGNAPTDETTDISLTYSSYNASLQALPVVIDSYNISYLRQDCADCPVPPARTVASGLQLNAGDNKTNTVTFLTAADKQQLPLSAVRMDSTNPILNQNPTTSDSHTIGIASAASLSLGQISAATGKSYAFPSYDGQQTSFSATLTPPVAAGSVSVNLNGSPLAVDNSGGTLAGGSNGSIQAQQLATADGTSTSFQGKLEGGIVPGSVTLKVGAATAANDNGSGTLSGSKTINVTSHSIGSGDGSKLNFQAKVDAGITPGSLAVKLSGNTIGSDSGGGVSGSWNAVAKGVQIGVGDGSLTSFQSQVNTNIVMGTIVVRYGGNVVATDAGGYLSGVQVSGSVNYTAGIIYLYFPTPPVNGGAITVDYQYGATLTGSINYSTGWMALSFSQPPTNGAPLTADYSYNSTVTGTVNYNTGAIVVTFTQPPANSTVISADYSYKVTVTGTINYATGALAFTSSAPFQQGATLTAVYNTNNSSVIVSGGTAFIPPVVISPGSGQTILKGTVALLLDGSVIARDDGNGNIVGSGVSGMVNYQSRVINAQINPPPTSGALTAAVSLQSANVSLTPTPIIPGSLVLQWGDISCGENAGVLQYPCAGSLDTGSGQISLTSIANTGTQNTTAKDVTASFKVDTSQVLGGDYLTTGDGSTATFALKLKYAPIAPPASGYALAIMTSDGLTVKDSGGGNLTCDVCSGTPSTVNYATGEAKICFKQAPGNGEGITAYYRTSSIIMKAIIQTNGHEVGGSGISVSQEITITVQ